MEPYFFNANFVPFHVSKCFPRDEDEEEETEGADTGRARRLDGLAMLDDDDGLDTGETTLPLECPPGYALCPAQLLQPFIHNALSGTSCRVAV